MGEQPLPPRLADTLAFVSRVVSRSLQETIEREESVSLEQWRTLRALAPADGRTMGELVECLAIPAASLTRLVDGLVDGAWVYRHASAIDRRRVKVLLSDSGRILLGRLEDIVSSHEAQLRLADGHSIDRLIAALDSMARADLLPRL